VIDPPAVDPPPGGVDDLADEPPHPDTSKERHTTPNVSKEQRSRASDIALEDKQPRLKRA